MQGVTFLASFLICQGFNSFQKEMQMLFFDILGLLFVTWKSEGPCDEIEDKRSVWTDFVSNQPSDVCFIPNLHSFS